MDEIVSVGALHALGAGHHLDAREVSLPVGEHEVEAQVHDVVAGQPLDRIAHRGAVLEHPAREWERGHAVRGEARPGQAVQHHPEPRLVQPSFAPPGSGAAVVDEAVSLASPGPIVLPRRQVLRMLHLPVGRLADQGTLVGVDESDAGTGWTARRPADHRVRAVEHENAIQGLPGAVGNPPHFFQALGKEAPEPLLHQAEPRLGLRHLDGGHPHPCLAGKAHRLRAGGPVLPPDFVRASGVVEVYHASALVWRAAGAGPQS